MAKILYDYQTFSLQRYGGISRYFATLIEGINNEPQFEAEIGMLYNANYYLQARHFGLNNKIGQAILAPKPSRAAKWNKLYSRYLIARNNFDLLHPTYYHPYFQKGLKKPFVLTVHDMIYELLPDHFLADDRVPAQKKETIARAAGLIAISETTKRDLMQVLNVPAHKIKTIYHGIAAQFESAPVAGLPAQYLLFVGTRSDYKNFKRLLPCFAELQKQHAGLQLICTGGGPFSEEEIQFQKKLGIGKICRQINVTDAGLNYLYQHAAAFVFPSLYEGFGYPLLEAFRAGCAVASSSTAALQEIGGGAVQYFDPTDEQSMFSAINELLNDSVLQERLVRFGFERVKEFLLEKEIYETGRFYNHIIGK